MHMKANPWKISEDLLEHLLHYVPSQGPIKDFIHHNTLHAFQKEKFDSGVLRAARLFGANPRLHPSEFREFQKAGRLSDECLKAFGLERIPEDPTPAPGGWVQDGIRVPGFQSSGVDILQKTRGPLFRILANYLDQGVAAHSHRSFPRFWDWLSHYFEGKALNFELLGHPYLQAALKKEPLAVIEESLPLLLDRPEYSARYLLEILLGHPGWSGLVHQVERKPEGLFDAKPITIVEFLALEIALDVAVSREIKGFTAFQGKGLPTDPREIDSTETATEKSLRLAQEALEWSFYLRKITKIEANATNPLPQRNNHVQVFFCIDDRECSIRRHLERLDEHVSTYGAAGFFGLDCKILEAGYPYMVQSCPVVLTPKVLIEEEFIETPEESFTRQMPEHHHHHLSRTYTHPLKAWVNSFWKGLQLSRDLVSQVFHPTAQEAEKPTRLKIHYSGERDGMRLGYTRQEMADRVFSVLRNVGFKREFSKLVIIMGHESSSNNNPHYAAYDCGACSGRTGAQNARAFAMMANDPEVRKMLIEKGLPLPQDCWFVGAVHNTTRDEVRYFDVQDIPDHIQLLFAPFLRTFEKALALNAKERTAKFDLFSKNGTPEQAHDHVRLRSVALFEPRPELNHATNAMCVVGRRKLTMGQNFDRRSFLHSYDPSTDPDGQVLTGILNAVVPVCGGINLEYYFSRMDNQVYGAGTKLPHNVVGLFGVSNGVIGDLRTGLPSQMIEVHDPLRLLIIVEQELSTALLAVKRNPATYEWIQNEWVHYACYNTADHKVYRLQGEEWKRVIP
ncbi:MAG: DUF2309 family protein [Bdellovibrionales bacterium]|nr:DUF2309 family protein [Bdellovibrionales bacterium]